MVLTRRSLMLVSNIISGPPEPSDAYNVNLNDDWRISTTVPNPDPYLYDGVYESYSNHNLSNSCASLTLSFSGLDTITVYVRSYAETGYDYVMVSQLDKVINQNTSYQYYDAVKAHTRTTQSSGTSIYNYTPVKFENIGGGDHTITIVYIKDSGTNTGDDRGYVLIGRDVEYYNPSVNPDTPDDPEEETMDINNYMTIEALEDGLSAMLSANACEYCIDGNNTWVSLSAGSYTPSINKGQTISFRANNIYPTSSAGIGTFSITRQCNLLGNCMSLLFGDNAKTHLSLNGYDYAFYRLFYGCTTIKSVAKGFLPAMALSNNCYSNMFRECTNLTAAPNLPADTLTSYAYYCMFYNCSNLSDAPIIGAIILGYQCCYYMFCNCTNLVTAPDLLATTLTSYCYYYMFKGCSKLNYIKMLATNVSASGCLTYWMSGVSSTGTFVKNANATWTNTGVSGVPSGWEIITV